MKPTERSGRGSRLDRLGRLLDMLRPGGPAMADAAFDAELAALGLQFTDPELEVEILRCLAAAGPMMRDVLRATLERTPKQPLGPPLERLVAAGYVVAVGRAVDLAPAWRGRFGEFARLPAADAPGAPKPPALEWGQALMALAAHKPCIPARIGEDLCAALGGPKDAELARQLTTRASAFGGETQTLIAWLAPKTSSVPLRDLLAFGVARVEAAATSALGAAPDRAAAVEASLFVCLSDFADVLTPAVLDAPGERREELLRRWCWFLGVPVPQERAAHSLRRLVSLDARRIRASLDAAAIDAEAQEVQKRLLDAERARRKAAAEAYASGRRE